MTMSPYRTGLPRARLAAALLALASLPGLASCSSAPPQDPGPKPTAPDKPRDIQADPAYWASNTQGERDEYVVTDSIPVTDTEANAEVELRDKALKRAVELTVKDLLRDPAKYRENENEIRRLIVDQFQKFIVSHDVVERRVFGDGRQLGVKLKVKADRGKIAKELQKEGLYRDDQQRMRAILIMRKPADGAADAGELAQGYLDDLAEGLSREMLDRGFEAKLWKDVRLSIAEKRDKGDKQTEDLISKFVEDSDWRKQEDERYDMPMIVLRSEGRLLCGFRILELERKGLAYHCTIRADAYELFNQQSLGYKTVSGKRAIESGGSLLEARQQLVNETAQKATKELCDSLQEYLDQRRREKKRDYVFTFDGYSEQELERIEYLMAGVVAEDIDSKNDGRSIVIRTKMARDPIPVQQEITRMLERAGLASKTPKRDGNSMSFSRKG